MKEVQMELKKMELALRVMDKALENPNPETFLEVPPELEHLSNREWENVAKLLICLETEMERSQIH
jgi:hypothetical protein